MTSGTGWPTHPTRRVVEANTSAVDGHYLEDVPEIAKDFRPGVVLVSKDWQPEMYLMRRHDGWTDDEYFEYAEKRIKELNLPPQRKDVVD